MSKTLVGSEDLERCAKPQWLWGAVQYVSILFDDVLSLLPLGEPPWNGEDGFFLWHVIASLALVEPLRDANYRARLLQGCKRVYLLSGFGSLFEYLATVTPDGIQCERS
jgi:hypothetical protein